MMHLPMGLVMLIVLQFEMDFGHPVTTKIEFERVDDDEHGFCIHNTKTVRLNLVHFEKLPLRHKRELIYHELGHCEFQLKHEPEDKVAIMRPIVYSTTPDISNWDDMVSYMRSKVDGKRRINQVD